MSIDWEAKAREQDSERSAGRPPAYPYATMAVGDTFTIPAGSGCPSEASIRAYTRRRGRQLGRQFLYHVHADGSIEVYRRS